jgi:nitrogen regulatory protein PII
MKRILAVIRPEKQAAVEEALKNIGAPGVTISKVVGFGEGANLFRSDWHMAHVRLVVYGNDEGVDQICRAIHDASHTGAPGDGFIAVIPVERYDRLRDNLDGEDATPERPLAPAPKRPDDPKPAKSSVLVWLLAAAVIVSLLVVYFVSPQHRIHAFVVAIALTLALSLVSTYSVKTD